MSTFNEGKNQVTIGVLVNSFFDDKLAKDDTVVRAVVNNLDVANAITGEKNNGMVSVVKNIDRDTRKYLPDITATFTQTSYQNNMGELYDNLLVRFTIDQVLWFNTFEEYVNAVNISPNYYLNADNSAGFNMPPFGWTFPQVGGYDTATSKWYLNTRKLPNVDVWFSDVGYGDKKHALFGSGSSNALHTGVYDVYSYASILLNSRATTVLFTSLQRTDEEVSSPNDAQQRLVVVEDLRNNIELNATYLGSKGDRSSINSPSYWLVGHYLKEGGASTVYYPNLEVLYRNTDTVLDSFELDASKDMWIAVLPQTRDITLRGVANGAPVEETFTAGEHYRNMFFNHEPSITLNNVSAVEGTREEEQPVLDINGNPTFDANGDPITQTVTIPTITYTLTGKAVRGKEVTVLEEDVAVGTDITDTAGNWVVSYTVDNEEPINVRKYLITGFDSDDQYDESVEYTVTKLSTHIYSIRSGDKIPIITWLDRFPDLTKYRVRHNPLWLNNFLSNPNARAAVEVVCTASAGNGVNYIYREVRSIETGGNRGRGAKALLEQLRPNLYTAFWVDTETSGYVFVVQDLDATTSIRPNWWGFNREWLISNNWKFNDDKGGVFNPVPFIRSKTKVSGNDAKSVNRILSRLGMTVEDVQEELLKKPDDFDPKEDVDPKDAIEEAWLDFGLDLLSTREGVKEYLFELFDHLYTPDSGLNYIAWRNDPVGKRPYVESISYRAGKYHKELKWHYIVKETLTGQASTLLSTSWGSGNELAPFKYNAQGMMSQSSEIESTVLTVRKNHKNNTYTEVSVYGLIVGSLVYKTRMVYQGLRKAHLNGDEFTRMYIPILTIPFNKLKYKNRRYVAYYCMNLSIFTVYKRKLRWFERTWVRVLFKVIKWSLVLGALVVSIWSGTPIPKALMNMALAYIGTWILGKILIAVVDWMGIENAFILAVIAVTLIVIGVATGNIKIGTAIDLLKLSTKHLEAIEQVSISELEKIAADMGNLIQSYNEQEKEYKDKLEALNNSSEWLMAGSSQTFNVDFNESPTDFINRCMLPTGSTDLSVQMIPNYVSSMLQLPKIDNNIRGFDYE